MSKTKIFFVSVVVIYAEIVASCGGKGNKWDRLLVNFPNLTPLPRTEDQALKEGWRNDASCESQNPFYGNRYALGDDISTRLLFDSEGNLAGIQGTITESDDLILSPTRPRPSAFVKDDHGHYLFTAYFTKKPQNICKKKPQRKGEDTLVIQTSDVRLCGKPRFMEIPLEEKKLDSKWVQGQCFRNMGVHYWYGISENMHCDQSYPVFLLYDPVTRRLKSFGWAALANLTSPMWEHPPIPFLSLFFKPPVPKCLLSRKVISTQHIYLTDPNQLICSK
ncbi:uncharacterized protein LOC113677445 [Pocillopora damicornis]|uniref:uncharacterized protein LOC113677445 n=1 Tax=Pocillopora damicornis TaxID=46731 RepID=UPI000F557800|nr:uncharacterized protein LOC113677445 [Pocillopora damicornis]